MAPMLIHMYHVLFIYFRLYLQIFISSAVMARSQMGNPYLIPLGTVSPNLGLTNNSSVNVHPHLHPKPPKGLWNQYEWFPLRISSETIYNLLQSVCKDTDKYRRKAKYYFWAQDPLCDSLFFRSMNECKILWYVQ